MSYTIVGMFSEHSQAEKAAGKLSSEGFSTDDYHVSRFSRANTNPEHKVVADGDANFNYKEDEKTSGFWNWLFGDDEDSKAKYSYSGSKNNIVTVFADNMENAERAKSILNDEGAVNVHNESKSYMGRSGNETKGKYEIDEQERARIISKAKNNLYFTDERNYEIKNHDIGMHDDMDSQGHNTGPL